MGAAAKTFGILLIIFAAFLMFSGLAGVIAGTVGNEAADQNCGLFGSGCDRDREDVNNALIAGGAVSLGLGIIVLVLGIVLVASGNAQNQQQQQQLVVDAESGDVSTQQQQQAPTTGERLRDPRAIAGIASGALVMLLVFLFVGTGDEGLLNPFAEEYPHPVRAEMYTGSLQNTGSLAGVEGNGHERRWPTHDDTEQLDFAVTWNSGDFGPDTLLVRFERVLVGDRETIEEHEVRSGEPIILTDTEHGSLEGVELAITILPADQTFVQSQNFIVTVTEWDVRPR